MCNCSVEWRIARYCQRVCWPLWRIRSIRCLKISQSLELAGRMFHSEFRLPKENITDDDSKCPFGLSIMISKSDIIWRLSFQETDKYSSKCTICEQDSDGLNNDKAAHLYNSLDKFWVFGLESEIDDDHTSCSSNIPQAKALPQITKKRRRCSLGTESNHTKKAIRLSKSFYLRYRSYSRTSLWNLLPMNPRALWILP